MNLNPIKWIVGAAGDAFGTWQERKAQAKEIEGAVKQARLDYRRAKFESKTRRLMTRDDNDASYDMQVLKNRQTTWLDEFLGVAIVAITICAFLPWTAPYVKEGWQAVSEAPFWFQFAWIVLISSTLGGLTILRIMMGSKIGNGVRKKIEASTSGASVPRETPTEGATNPHREEKKETRDEETSYPFDERKGR